jgi:hypothetical protein
MNERVVMERIQIHEKKLINDKTTIQKKAYRKGQERTQSRRAPWFIITHTENYCLPLHERSHSKDLWNP